MNQSLVHPCGGVYCVGQNCFTTVNLFYLYIQLLFLAYIYSIQKVALICFSTLGMAYSKIKGKIQPKFATTGFQVAEGKFLLTTSINT